MSSLMSLSSDCCISFAKASKLGLLLVLVLLVSLLFPQSVLLFAFSWFGSELPQPSPLALFSLFSSVLPQPLLLLSLLEVSAPQALLLSFLSFESNPQSPLLVSAPQPPFVSLFSLVSFCSGSTFISTFSSFFSVCSFFSSFSSSFLSSGSISILFSSLFTQASSSAGFCGTSFTFSSSLSGN